MLLHIPKTEYDNVTDRGILGHFRDMISRMSPVQKNREKFSEIPDFWESRF